MILSKQEKETRHEKFLQEMNRTISWNRLISLIEPYYPKAGNGRPPMPLQQMLRIYFMQRRYSLSDPAMEDSFPAIESMRRFTNKDRVLTRETLLDKVWGYDYFGGDRTVDVHISRLRSKIEDHDHSFIDTVRNVGYKFKTEK